MSGKLEAPSTAPKAGFLTSEFYLAIVVIIADLAGAISGVLPPAYAGIGAAIASGLYALARAFTKSGVAQAKAEGA